MGSCFYDKKHEYVFIDNAGGYIVKTFPTGFLSANSSTLLALVYLKILAKDINQF